MDLERSYLCVDLKSFYASVECVERGLDPLGTNLVVADESRTEKTICLAVSPSLKAYGIPGRARLFEVVQKVKQANVKRRLSAPDKKLTGESHNAAILQNSPEKAISYIAAPPRMALYMRYSANIYDIYLNYVAPEDIHVYSIDEVFIDMTNYLRSYELTALELARNIIRDVFNSTGITATAGLGTNLYLSKVAMDIVAKHAPPDENGARIATLDEMSYRRQLWSHRPLTDFWRVGRGYARKLEKSGLFTMGDIARCSVGKPTDYFNEDFLYKLFGINAELLIDHAWGWEPCTMADIKGYKPSTNSVSTTQVLATPYTFEKGRVIAREMTEFLVLDLVDKGLVTDQMVLMVAYDIVNLADPEIEGSYKGEVVQDFYGRDVPKPTHKAGNLDRHTSSTRLIVNCVMDLYDHIVDRKLLIRRLTIGANRVIDESAAMKEPVYEQIDMFTDYEAAQKKRDEETKALEREKKIQRAALEIMKKYGKNAILKGMSLQDGATAMARNKQIGGHKA